MTETFSKAIRIRVTPETKRLYEELVKSNYGTHNSASNIIRNAIRVSLGLEPIEEVKRGIRAEK